MEPDEKLNLDERGYILLNSTLTSPKTIRELPTKNYVEHNLDDPSKTKNTTHVDFNDKNLDNVRFVKVNSMATVREQLTPQHFVDHAISYWVYESSLLRIDPDKELKPGEQDSKFLNFTLTSPKTIIEKPTKS